MASWGLRCKNCGAVFTHSLIADTLADHFLPTRPEFPPNGIERECPSCKVKSRYQAIELVYKPDRYRP
jgi:rubredoxin